MSPTDLAVWPDPTRFRHVNGRGGRHYESLDGLWAPMPGVTTVLKVLGLGTEGLIKWSATEERKAALEAAGEVYKGWRDHGISGDPATFVATVEAGLGPARQHQKQLTKAGDIGTAAHAAIHDWLCGRPLPEMADESLWATMAFQSWWNEAGLTFVRGEQPVYDTEYGFAGTVDILATDAHGHLGVVDIKTSKGIYDDYHLQVAAYMHAARNFAPIKWGKIVRVPKVTTDPEFEVKELGDAYERRIAEADLFKAFTAALTAWRVLKGA